MLEKQSISKLLITSLLLITLIGIAIGAVPNPGHDVSQIDGLNLITVLEGGANAGSFTGTAYIGQTGNFPKWKLAVRNDSPGDDGGAIHGYSQNAIGIYGWAGGGRNPILENSYIYNAGIVGYNDGANPGGTFISKTGAGLIAETRNSSTNLVALELINGGIQFDDGTIQATAAGSGTADPETDPQVGTIQDNKWCRGETATNPDSIICDQDAPTTPSFSCTIDTTTKTEQGYTSGSCSTAQTDSCPTGYELTGGGVTCTDSTATGYVIYSRPSGEKWEAKCCGTTSTRANAYAICTKITCT